jgi:predicted kinase
MIEILIGNIASGKSTYCSRRAREGAVIISDDAIVNGLHSDQYELYDKKLKPLYKAVENQIVASALMLGKDVVVDRGLNLTIKSRRRFIGLGHSLDSEVIAVVFYFEPPQVHADRRQAHDLRNYSHEYWLDVATAFDNKYIPPISSEGFDEIITIDPYP